MSTTSVKNIADRRAGGAPALGQTRAMSSLAPLPDEAAPRHVGRSTIAMILIVLGSLLAPVAIVGWYVRAEILDTDRFVAVVTPLATDTAIQDALIDRVTVEI